MYMRIHVHKFMNMYIHVCTMFRHVCTVFQYPVQGGRIPDESHAWWTQIGALIQCWSITAYMSRIHSIVSDSHRTQKSILRNILVNMVHTSMYWYILSSYLDIQVDQHVLYMVKGAL